MTKLLNVTRMLVGELSISMKNQEKLTLNIISEFVKERLRNKGEKVLKYF